MRAVIWIVLVAAALRVAVVAYGGEAWLIAFEDDQRLYDALAENLASGLGYRVGMPAFMIVLPGEPTAFWTPAFPLLLAGLYSVVGHSVLAARAVLGVLASLLTVVLFALGRRVAGPRVGLAAAVAVALHPLYVAYGGTLLSEGISVLLAASVLLWVYRLLDEPSGRAAAALGALVGLGGLTRPDILGLGAVVAVGSVAVWPGNRRSRLKLLWVSGLVAVAVVSPWLARNYQVYGRLLLTTRTGYSLWYQNPYQHQRLQYQWSAEDARSRYAAAVEEDIRRIPAEPDRDRALRDLGLEFIRHHPAAYARMALKRVYATFPFLPESVRERLWPAVQRFLFGRDAVVRVDLATELHRPRLLALADGLTLPLIVLAVVGVWASRRDWRRVAPLVIAVAYYVALAAVLVGNPRIRLNVEFAVVLLAVLGGRAVVNRGGARADRSPIARSAE